MTFDASLTTFLVFVHNCERRGTNRRGWNLIFSAQRLGWLEVWKALVRYSGRAASQVIKYDTRLRRLHPLFQVKMERKQHPVSVFQPGNNWQLSFSSLLFLLHPGTQAYEYTMESVTNPHRHKHQCARSLCQSVSEVKLFHPSWVLLSSYKASVRTAGRLIVTY